MTLIFSSGMRRPESTHDVHLSIIITIVRRIRSSGMSTEVIGMLTCAEVAGRRDSFTLEPTVLFTHVFTLQVGCLLFLPLSRVCWSWIIRFSLRLINDIFACDNLSPPSIRFAQPSERKTAKRIVSSFF